MAFQNHIKATPDFTDEQREFLRNPDGLNLVQGGYMLAMDAEACGIDTIGAYTRDCNIPSQTPPSRRDYHAEMILYRQQDSVERAEGVFLSMTNTEYEFGKSVRQSIGGRIH